MDNSRYLTAIVNRKKRIIPIDSVNYVESRGRKVILHCQFGEIVFYSKISEIEDILTKNGFVRIHQSFMVRKNMISNVSRFCVSFGTEELPVSRRYYTELRNLMEGTDKGE